MANTRSQQLTANSNIALALAVPPATFLAISLTGSNGEWASVHTWLAATVAAAALTSATCHVLAARTAAQEVTHEVTHSPSTDLPETPMTCVNEEEGRG